MLASASGQPLLVIGYTITGCIQPIWMRNIQQEREL